MLKNTSRTKKFVAGFDVDDTDNYGGLYNMYDGYSVASGMVDNGMLKKNDLMWSDEYVG